MKDVFKSLKLRDYILIAILLIAFIAIEVVDRLYFAGFISGSHSWLLFVILFNILSKHEKIRKLSYITAILTLIISLYIFIDRPLTKNEAESIVRKNHSSDAEFNRETSNEYPVSSGFFNPKGFESKYAFYSKKNKSLYVVDPFDSTVETINGVEDYPDESELAE